MNKEKPYTQEEQEEFRPLVVAKLEEARNDLKLLEDSLAEGMEVPSIEEQASGAITPEEMKQLADRQRRYIQHLEDAEKRIDNGTYGMCRVTGARISKERLRLVPHAGLSIAAKQDMAG
jgi:RNA polymerase-binding transcription factor DksA